MEVGKGRRSLFALLGALAVATIFLCLMVVVTTAKPAEAATTCTPSAKAPFYSTISGVRYINFRTNVSCTAPIQEIGIRSYGYQYLNGGYQQVAYKGAAVTNSPRAATITSRVKCTGAYTPYSFGTTNQNSYVVNNGRLTYLRTVYSSVVSLNC
jgi:hypothetical protein